MLPNQKLTDIVFAVPTSSPRQKIDMLMLSKLLENMMDKHPHNVDGVMVILADIKNLLDYKKE